MNLKIENEIDELWIDVTFYYTDLVSILQFNLIFPRVNLPFWAYFTKNLTLPKSKSYLTVDTTIQTQVP